MATQQETLNFGPQWIRELADFAPNAQRTSSFGAMDPHCCATTSSPNDIEDNSSRTSVDDGSKCRNSTQIHYCGRERGPKADGDKGPDVSSAAWNNSAIPSTMHQSWHRRPVTNPPRPIDLTPGAYGWDASQAHCSDSMSAELRAGGLDNSSNNLDVVPIYSSARTAECSLLDTVDIATRSSSEVNTLPTSLWDQEHRIWSKSVPQHLHGLESTGPLTDTLPSLLSKRHIADSFPGADKSSSSTLPDPLFPRHPPDRSERFDPATSQSNNFSVLEVERDPRGSDYANQSDEHLWFYEDPQGHTQGSFTDSQMNDWLSAGIYFTSNLRMRRKCDSEFSTLADYTCLFGRIPFTPGPRVPPIRGGITASMLKGAAKESVSLLGSVERSASTNPAAIDGGRFCVPHSAPVTAMSNTNGLVPAVSSHATPCQANFQASVTSSDPRVSVPLIDSNRSPIPKTLSTGVCANSSLPVMQSRAPPAQVTSLSSFGGLNMCGQSNYDTNLHHIGCATQPAVSASTLMALASLISVNPALASLALSFSGQSQIGGSLDLRAAALTPGFLTALAQYLNVQPHGSGHPQVSPMQQLAETAQLAAQLAAMAGAYSPDQTPMQPSQALALAELVRSQASPWPPVHARKDSAGGDTSQGSTTEAGERQMENGSCDVAPNAASSHRFLSSAAHTATATKSLLLSNEDPRSASQSLWPFLHTTIAPNDSGPARNSPRRTDGFSSQVNAPEDAFALDHQWDGASRSTRNSLPSHQTSKRQSQTTSMASTGLHSAVADRPKSQSKPVNDVSRSVNGSTDSSIWRWTSSAGTGKRPDDTGFNGDTQSPASHQAPGGSHWANKVKQAPTKPTAAHVPHARPISNNEASRRTARAPPPPPSTGDGNTGKSTRGVTTRDNNHRTGTTDQSKCASKATVALMSTTYSPSKPTTRSNPKSPTTLSVTTAVSTATIAASTTVTTPTDPDRTAEHELRRLTEWCQTRLSTMPMREKVDIPTLVELLATLDAPYEVERMVHTFLNESTRTSLFVKDFLDQRRPFWQLHRERREKESVLKSVSQSDAAKETTSRCNDKKRSSIGHGPGGTVPTGCNGGAGWTKTGAIQMTVAQDTQWHHIKPKGNHNRRGKKDKSS